LARASDWPATRAAKRETAKRTETTK